MDTISKFLFNFLFLYRKESFGTFPEINFYGIATWCVWKFLLRYVTKNAELWKMIPYDNFIIFSHCQSLFLRDRELQECLWIFNLAFNQSKNLALGFKRYTDHVTLQYFLV